MAPQTLSKLLASRTPIIDEDIQRVIVGIPGMAELLAQNEYTPLADDVWFQLYTVKPKPTADVAEGLVNRPLTPAQIDHVIANEARTRALTALVYHHPLTVTQQETLAASKAFKTKVAEALGEAPWCEPGLARRCAEAAGGKMFLEWLAHSPLDVISDAEVIDWLDRFDDWAPRRSKERRALLLTIMHRRPAVIGPAVRTGNDDLILVAAGCRHLTDTETQWLAAGFTADHEPPDFASMNDVTGFKYRWMALGNNPVCNLDLVQAMIDAAATSSGMVEARTSLQSRMKRAGDRPQVTVPYEQVDDPTVIDWLVSRSLPFTSTYGDSHRPARAWDLAALAQNPHMEGDHPFRVHQALNHLLEDVNPSGDMLRHRLEELYEHLRPEGWSSTPPAPPGADEGSWHANAYRDPSIAVVDEPTDAQLERAAGWRTDNMTYSSPEDRAYLLRIVDARIAAAGADKTTAYQTLFGLIDGFDGTVDELAEIITLV